ncbi:1-hydroxycarotenoid 3,4-desaturase CrtD [Cytophaga aurantiaca]|uniref:1-hydroxycarotenoid 3,4-desaturase CrtD n=1 Tax=Cytophaga aurantiaca TaxID=29530 RepID=UPI000374143A|nr:1-hydroxycarotenoid 3,4-desaturase CrtD [Cytophaga aurantiaca]
MKAIVIGGGLGGLSTAIRLASAGYKVDVFESASGAGGKLNEKVISDYRFDLGPSLLTMPDLIDDLFIEAGEDPRLHFNYSKLDTICNYFYEDGTVFKSYADDSKFENELYRIFRLNKNVFRSYFKTIRTIYSITAHIFIFKSLHRFRSFTTWKTLVSIFQLPLIRSGVTMNKMNESFFSDPRLIQYFNRYATYNGSNPYKAPGTINLISHLEHEMGAYLPKGGMYAITNSLYGLACRKGVNFHFNELVQEIIVSNKKAVGIRTAQSTYNADIIISNMDIFHTYRKLLPNQPAPEKILRQEKSSSALIFYWGLNTSFSKLGLHNILFSSDYKKEFKSIWEEKTIDEDPTIYINITSKYESNDAPTGCENWFVMINVPHNSGQNWELLKQQARKNIITKINRMLQTSIEEHIVVEDYLDPILIESRTSSFKGALYGNASNNKLAAFLRHSNFSKTIKGLYFCGGSVHPGGGVPLAILSGKITAELIKKDLPC